MYSKVFNGMRAVFTFGRLQFHKAAPIYNNKFPLDSNPRLGVP